VPFIVGVVVDLYEKQILYLLWSKPVQFCSRLGPMCKEDKRFRASIYFVVTRVTWGGGEVTEWYFEFVLCSLIDLQKLAFSQV
jgi:hypothetical protein